MIRNFKLFALFGFALITFNMACSSKTEEKSVVEEAATVALKPAKIVYYAIPG
jgi:hypothetical protein